MRHKRVILLVCILIFITLTHSSYILNGFTWLDHGDIEASRALIPFSKIYLSFVNRFGETSFYRPLVTVFHVTDTFIYGTWTPGFHITNLILHLAASVAAGMFISVFSSLTSTTILVLILLFGIHPLSWLPVGSISYRPELLVSLCTYLAVYFHAKARTSHSPIYNIMSVCSILLALFSKETALFWIPALILLWEYKTIRNLHKGLKTDHAGHIMSGYPLIAAEVIAIVFYVLLRMYAVPEIWKIASVPQSVLQAIFTRLYVLGNTIINLVSPLKPSLSDATPVAPFTHIYSIISILSLLLFAGYTYVRRRHPQAFLIIMLLAVSLLPTLNITPLPRFNSPHYGYFAVAAAAYAAVVIYRHIAVRNMKLIYVYKGILVIWIIISSLTIYRFGPRFKDDVNLFTPEVEADAYFLEGAYYLGSHYWQKGDLIKAEKYFKQALTNNASHIAYVDRSSLNINYSGVLFMRGALNKADAYLVKSLDYSPHSMKLLITYNRALVAAKKNDYPRIIALLDNDNIHLDRIEPLLLLAHAHDIQGNTSEAIRVLKHNLSSLNDVEQYKIKEIITDIAVLDPMPTLSPHKEKTK